MMKNCLLQARLKLEKNWLEEYYNEEKFPMNEMYGMTVFERDVKTSRNNVYRLRILVGESYPDKLPDLVVCLSPEPMPKSAEWQGTHTTHTWPQKYGLLQICFYRQECWTRKNRLLRVFEKGEQWLEAYEEHLETGKPIDEILIPMEATDKEIEEKKRQEARNERAMAKYDEVQLGIRK